MSDTDNKIAVLIKDVHAGKRRALAKAITLVESTRGETLEKGQHLLEQLLPYTGKSIRLGITGIPGVGKSTFIEMLGMKLITEGHRVAVLAVDPSSPQSGGSILGDKTRMEHLSTHENAFIRPSPTGGKLGGVSRKTREAMLLCEAAGYDVILIETVGVGQSEYDVASMVDFFLVLMQPGTGDSLQGIKRGILEIADLLIINKADGDLLQQAKRSHAEYKKALHLLRPKNPVVPIEILLCSSLKAEGLDDIWSFIEKAIKILKEKGHFDQRRSRQRWEWTVRLTEEILLQQMWSNEKIQTILPELKNQVEIGKTTPVLASKKLLQMYGKA